MHVLAITKKVSYAFINEKMKSTDDVLGLGKASTKNEIVYKKVYKKVYDCHVSL